LERIYKFSKKCFFLDPSKEVKHSRFRASTAICLHAFMLSIINLGFLFLFGVEPLAKYFSKKILFRQAQRHASPVAPINLPYQRRRAIW
jgi:hypothetical protein